MSKKSISKLNVVENADKDDDINITVNTNDRDALSVRTDSLQTATRQRRSEDAVAMQRRRSSGLWSSLLGLGSSLPGL